MEELRRSIRMPYVYNRLGDLKNAQGDHNFYGKLIFKKNINGITLLILKDETSWACVQIKPERSDFELRQIVRFHRCFISGNKRITMAIAPIGKKGCHFVAWPKNGDADTPEAKSSATWTKSSEDEERIRTLSNLTNINTKKHTLEELVSMLNEGRVGKTDAPANDAKLRKIADLLMNGRMLRVVHFKSPLPIDNEYFEFQRAAECENCPDCQKYVVYQKPNQTLDDRMKCPRCNTLVDSPSIRTKAKLEDYQIHVTFPLRILTADLSLTPENMQALKSLFGKVTIEQCFCKTIAWSKTRRVAELYVTRANIVRLEDV